MTEPSADWPTPRHRAWLIAAATLAPGISGWTSYAVAAPHWQSNRFSDYVALILANSALVFAPLLLYSSACLALALFYPSRYLPYFGVRFGIYAGVALSVHLIVMCFGALGGHNAQQRIILWPALIISTSLPFLFAPAARVLKRQSSEFRQGAIVIGIPVAIMLFCFSPLLWILWLSLPGWCFFAYARVARIVFRNYGGSGQFRLSEAIWLMTWAGTYLAAWRISVNRALVEYAELPKTDPRCYVCTAAARGDRWLVGAEEVAVADDTVIFVNLQMCRLKAAEIALKALAPRSHRMLRSVYDRAGPYAAACLKHRLAADAAYLALKPIEWLAYLVLGCLLTNSDGAAKRLYRG
ncbi:MAG TPA: DUF6688 family protein [Pirellulales bacterium]|nr:DUF6688 family protein [Pirellulales bacterium]